MEMRTIRDVLIDACTGCGACTNICPKDCVAMIADGAGFLRPSIDQSKCIGCGKCRSVCPALTKKDAAESQIEPQCYAAWSLDDEIRFHSTSGGIFTHLAQSILRQGGVVVGARYRKDHTVEHAMISSEAELPALRQSKYVQSDVGLVYRDVRSRLEHQQPALFVGTPCQCAGLRRFLGRDYNTLYLCDFICRGVNSPVIYRDYLKELENSYGSAAKRVWFKNKTISWNKFCTKVLFQDGQEYLADRETDPYMLGYIKSDLSCYMRPSCYQCDFKGIKRPVDITLGDFWGVEKQFPDIHTEKGVSLVLAHSEKALSLLSGMRNEVSLIRADLAKALEHNTCALSSVKNGVSSEMFYQKLKEKGSFKKTIQLCRDKNEGDI